MHWDAVAQREFLEVASAETDRLAALVTDLLDLSQIQAGTFTVHKEPCELTPLVQRAASRVRPPVAGRLRVSIAPNLARLHADPPRLEAVLRNLFENAAKYAPVGTPIWFSAEPNGNCVLIRVEDQGPGIAPEHRARVFDRFYRIDSRLDRSTSGAGLGLAICKGFVEAHGGEIWIEPSDHGAVFALTLPL